MVVNTNSPESQNTKEQENYQQLMPIHTQSVQK